MRKSIAGLAAAAGLLMAPAAQAADVRTFSNFGGSDSFSVSLYYFADPGETNSPTLTQREDGRRITIEDPTATLRSSDDSCLITDEGRRAVCADDDGFSSINADLGDRDDVLVTELASDVQDNPFFGPFHRLDGGPGNDRITGSDDASDAITGGSGDDELDGRGRDDSLSDDSFFSGYPGDSGGDRAGGFNRMRGGAGNDLITGGPAGDELDGGPDDDYFFDPDGGATMLGGPGEDIFQRSTTVGDRPRGNAAIDGGGDIDEVIYGRFDPNRPMGHPDPASPGVTVRLDVGGPTTGNGGGGQDDSVAGIEDVVASPASDTVSGSAVSNAIFAADGNDRITGGGGRDNVEAGAGADNVEVTDGEPDRVRCSNETGGDPGDTVGADEVDILERCPAEGSGTAITRPTPPGGNQNQNPAPGQQQQGPPQISGIPPVKPPPPPDRSRPNIGATKLAKTVKLSTLRRRGYSFTVRSTDPQRNQAVATLTGKTKGRTRIAAIGDVIIAQRTKAFTRTTRIRLKPRGKLRNAIRRKSRLRMLLEVRDAAGNVSRRSVTIRVR